MKKLFTILCATLLSIGVFAQAATETGTFLLSGSTGLDFSSQGVTDNEPVDATSGEYSQKAGSMELDLLGAYFMMDGLAAGLAVIYDKTSSSWESTSSGTTSSYSYSNSIMLIAPTVRYYFGESGVWLQAQYGFGSVSYNEEDKSGTTTQSEEGSNGVSALRFGAGYAIALSDNISLNPSVGYSSMTQTEKADENTYSGYPDADGNWQDLKTTTAGLTFGLGITLHLEN